MQLPVLTEPNSYAENSGFLNDCPQGTGVLPMKGISLEYLHSHPDLISALAAGFREEWPDYYGTEQSDAECDLRSYANRHMLPIGVVATFEGSACGFMALKKEPFSTHPDLFPWVGAAWVKPSLRRQGIGRMLLDSMEREARALGISRVYCATGTAASLLERAQWTLLERVTHEAQTVAIYTKNLAV